MYQSGHSASGSPFIIYKAGTNILTLWNDVTHFILPGEGLKSFLLQWIGSSSSSQIHFTLLSSWVTLRSLLSTSPRQVFSVRILVPQPSRQGSYGMWNSSTSFTSFLTFPGVMVRLRPEPGLRIPVATSWKFCSQRFWISFVELAPSLMMENLIFFVCVFER